MISIVNDWHKYSLEERHAPWKLFLPVTTPSQILAINLNGSCLASLGRTWSEVHYYGTSTSEIEWASDHARSLGQIYQFNNVGHLSSVRSHYQAIAVNSDNNDGFDLNTIYRLLEPGGAVVWVGRRNRLPSRSELLLNKYENIRRYALLPPITGKLMVPLDNATSTKVGLNLFYPRGWKNRTLLKIGRVVTSVGGQGLISSNQVIIARKPGNMTSKEYFLDSIGNLIGQPVADATVYTGWTKLICQLFDSQSHVIGFAKIADTVHGRRALERENRVLKTLQGVPELINSIPRVLYIGEWNGHAVQIQTPVGSVQRKSSSKLTRTHLNFLATLRSLDHKEATLDQWPWWPKIWSWVHDNNNIPFREAEALRVAIERSKNVLKNKRILFHRVHGDFSPWNIFIDNDCLLVTDWEQSVSFGFPFFDIAYFILQQDYHARNREFDIKSLTTKSIRELDSYINFKPFVDLLQIDADIAELAIILAYIVLKYPLLRDRLCLD